ncbi:hypothetical protein [Streptomyces sp. NPDC097619]|uniref:hypothetical protein n=1 Tax=Streptomyces sp. NPDC097619 TaxID=3157228 RepID=UPI0033193650
MSVAADPVVERADVVDGEGADTTTADPGPETEAGAAAGDTEPAVGGSHDAPHDASRDVADPASDSVSDSASDSVSESASGGTSDGALDPVTRDAREFGGYARQGGWTFALKVARSVRPGGPSAADTGAEGSGSGSGAVKVSAQEFARRAGCSPERVMRFWKAWDRAADDGVVPVFEALVPGEDIDLPDADVWLGYYTSRSSAASPRGLAISAVAEAEGIRPTKALEVAENPTALRAAILADPATAQAARHALIDRLEDDPALGQELARDIARTGEWKKAVAAEAKTVDRLEYVRQVIDSGEVTTPSGQKIPAPEEVVAEARQHLHLIEGLDDEEAGPYAEDAQKAVKQLIADAVENDPRLRAHERRVRFQSKVQKAAKAFEELTLDDAAAVYEEELLEQLEKLQESIAECIRALRSEGSRPAAADDLPDAADAADDSEAPEAALRDETAETPDLPELPEVPEPEGEFWVPGGGDPEAGPDADRA